MSKYYTVEIDLDDVIDQVDDSDLIAEVNSRNLGMSLKFIDDDLIKELSDEKIYSVLVRWAKSKNKKFWNKENLKNVFNEIIDKNFVSIDYD